jgi:hypothetical protein
MKIRTVGAELFHEDRRTDGRTDRQLDKTKLIDAFRNFTNAPTNKQHLLESVRCKVYCRLVFVRQQMEHFMSLRSVRRQGF